MRWRLFVASLGMWFFALNSMTQAQQIRAETGGIAIGGSVSGSTINIGIAPEQLAALVKQTTDLSEAQKTLIVSLQGQLDLNQRQIRAALDILGERDIPPESLAGKLVEIAERFKALHALMTIQPGDGPNLATAKIDVQKIIDAGDLVKADALLAEVEMAQRNDLDRRARNIGETSAKRGEIALARLRYSEAAGHFANAAVAVPPGRANESQRIGYLQREAIALYRQGNEFGDNSALRSAIELNKRLLELLTRERVPLKWASTQNNLGLALVVLGEREWGAARIIETPG